MNTFPKLNCNPDLQLALKQKRSAEEQIEEITKDIRDCCDHELENQMIEDKNYCNFFVKHDHKVLSSKLCLQCGYEEKRPKGEQWDICYKCWGKMEHIQTVPGQGERIHVYKCSSCGHREAHT